MKRQKPWFFYNDTRAGTGFVGGGSKTLRLNVKLWGDRILKTDKFLLISNN